MLKTAQGHDAARLASAGRTMVYGIMTLAVAFILALAVSTIAGPAIHRDQLDHGAPDLVRKYAWVPPCCGAASLVVRVAYQLN